MEQVSSFFEHILAVENGDEVDSQEKNKVNETREPHKHPHEKSRRRSELEHLFWRNKKDDKDESKSGNTLLTDKLMEKIISMIVPMNVKDQGVLNERLIMQKTRPPLSMNIMSKNSILLVQRLSVPFETIDGIIKFFNWHNPSFTVGILLILTHVVLNPYLLLVLPIFLVIITIMVPHYLVLHSPDKSLLNEKWFTHNPVPDDGPALHEYKTPKPVPEFSSEFVINLTDLQNHMLIYVVAFDFILWITTDLLYYKNENITSIVFLWLIILSFHNLFILPKILPHILRYMPIKFIIIISLWIVTILLHPVMRNAFLNWFYKEDTRLYFLKINNKIEDFLLNLIVNVDEEQLNIESRDVEVFELQKYNKDTKIWELVGFANDFYTINSPLRKFNQNATEEDDSNEEIDDSVKITLKLGINNVKPPVDWEFKQSSWKLDLDVTEWVNSNLLSDLVMIDTDEKWVYDLDTADAKELFRRRRWLRACSRHTSKKDANQANSASTFSDYLL